MRHFEASSGFNDLSQGSALERFWFPAYLTFSVCFYSLRFLFGWGSDQTTRYESDMPSYLAVLKDIAWFGLLSVTVCNRGLGRAIAQAKRHPLIYLLLCGFCIWMLVCSIVHLLFYYEPLTDSLLYNIRMPLEYIPAAFLAPAFICNWGRVGTMWKWLNCFAIIFAAFEFVAVLGGWKQTGFDWGG